MTESTKGDKTNWYDGWIYDRFIAPNQDRMYLTIKQQIKKGSRVIDVGCGTGRFAQFFKEHLTFIKGIDLSSRNISIARKNFSHQNNLKFEHVNASNFDDGEKYDYAVITYVIHEMEYDDQIKLLENFKYKAMKLIVGEYIVPHPINFWGILNWIVEFLAGANHFKNFRRFIRTGGVKTLAFNTGYEVEKEILNQPSTSAIYILKPL